MAGDLISGLKGIFGIFFFALKWILIVGLVLTFAIVIYFSIRSIMDSMKERKLRNKFNQELEEFERE